jgi:hypothetical protein
MPSNLDLRFGCLNLSCGLASHVADAVDELETKRETLLGKVERGGLAASMGIPQGTRSELVDSMVAAVEGLGLGIRVLRIEKVAARAIYDQIVSVPPGDLENGVRTGAADSAWIRAVHEEANNDSDAYIIVSADAHVQATFAEWKATPPRVFKSSKALHRYLFPTEPASAATAIAFARSLVMRVGQGWPGAQDLRPFSNEDAVVKEVFDYEESFLGARVIDASVDRAVPLKLVGLNEVVKDRDRERVHGLAFFLADITIAARVMSSSADATLQRENLQRVIRVDVVGDLTKDGVQNIEAEGDAVIVETEERWSDLDQGLGYQECLDVLTLIPEMSDFDADSFVFGADNDYKDSSSQTFSLTNGKTLKLESSYDPGDSWEIFLYAESEGEMVQLICEYDHGSWAGGVTGFNVEPPWALRAEGDTDLQRHPYFALTEFGIRKSLES